MIPGLHAVIPAGGAGTRLWPFSRAARPKFLLDVDGSGRTLIQQTYDRLAPLAQRVMVVTGADHAGLIRGQLPGLAEPDVVIEPAPRDSMPAIGLAAALLARQNPEAVMGSFAADHVIRDQTGFAAAVEAAAAAAQAGYIATIGIVPTGPSVAYGYIRAGETLGLAGAPQACLARNFAEKPDLATAQAYLASGQYRWNAGMFVFRVEVLLDHLARLQPAMYGAIMELAEAWDSSARQSVAERVWPRLTKLAIDHAVAEPVATEGGVATVPGDFDWDDVGDFAALAGLLPPGPDGERQLRLTAAPGPLVLEAAPGAFVVRGTDRVVAVVGIADAVVVDTPAALLVTRLEASQLVKGVADQLRDAGWQEYL